MTTARMPKRADAAISLRMAGASTTEIAEVLNYPSAEAVETAIVNALASQATEDDRTRARGLARLRYERLLRSLWTTAVNPESPQQLSYARAAREIVDKIVVLDGAAAPAEFVIHSPTATQLQQWVARVISVSVPELEEADPFLPAQDRGVIDAEVVESSFDSEA